MSNTKRPWETEDIKGSYNIYGQWVDWMNEKMSNYSDDIADDWSDVPEYVKPLIYGIMCDLVDQERKTPMSDKKQEPKACKFCGGENIQAVWLGGLWKTACGKCGSSGGLCETEAESVAAWNTRPEPAPKPAADKVDVVFDALNFLPACKKGGLCPTDTATYHIKALCEENERLKDKLNAKDAEILMLRRSTVETTARLEALCESLGKRGGDDD